MKIIKDVPYKDGGANLLDVYLPESGAFDVFVYFHGGGLTNGSRAEGRLPAEYLTSRGVAVVSADYRMYPSAKFPDFIEDAADAVAWAKTNMKKYGAAGRLFVGGSSAGGYLSMMLCFDGRYLARAGLSVSDVAGFVHDAGQPTSHFNVLKERGVDSRRVIVDETAPLFFVGTSEKYPPMTFIVSTHDMKNRYEQTMLMLSTLSAFGHESGISLSVQEGGHCAYVGARDERGESKLGKLVYDFIASVE